VWGCVGRKEKALKKKKRKKKQNKPDLTHNIDWWL